MHVLVCEDDDLIASGIVAGLGAQGFTVERVGTAAAARAMLKAAQFDIMVLDLGLPDEDGLRLLQQQRSAGLEIPVLILTARDSVTNRVEACKPAPTIICSSLSTCANWPPACRPCCAGWLGVAST